MEQNKETTKPIQYKKKERKRELPKNVRQIGEIAGKQRIYVEDYVVTYLNQLAHPTNTVARGAILLGEWVHYDKEDVLFISGAIEADHLSFDMREVSFSDETWTQLYEKINQYFEEINVVGWFLSRLGYSIKLTDSMRKLHSQYFKGQGSVLYLMDALEQEDAFFLNKEGKLQQQPGYYIYYERNTPMQNYLIENQAIERTVGQDKRIDYKDGQLLHSYHEIMASRQGRKDEKRVTSLLYVTSAMLVIVFLALSISIFNNYDKLKSVQESLNVIMGGDQLANADKGSEKDGVEAQTVRMFRTQLQVQQLSHHRMPLTRHCRYRMRLLQLPRHRMLQMGKIQQQKVQQRHRHNLNKFLCRMRVGLATRILWRLREQLLTAITQCRLEIRCSLSVKKYIIRMPMWIVCDLPMR